MEKAWNEHNVHFVVSFSWIEEMFDPSHDDYYSAIKSSELIFDSWKDACEEYKRRKKNSRSANIYRVTKQKVNELVNE